MYPKADTDSRNLLLLFESARETPVKRLKAIAPQRKPRSLQFKLGCSVEFWQSFIVDIIVSSAEKKLYIYPF